MFYLINCHIAYENQVSMSVVKFIAPVTCILSGSTSSGKTYWLNKLFQNKNDMFDEEPRKIMFCYNIWQQIFIKMQSDQGVQFHQGIPSEDDIDNFTDGVQHTAIVIDDLQNIASKSQVVEKLFTCISHHRRISVFLIVQIFFTQGPSMRNISLNAHIIVLFKNARDKNQISVLCRQLGIEQLLMLAYKDATKIKYNPLIIDLSPHSDEQYKLRSQVFPQDLFTIIYQ